MGRNYFCEKELELNSEYHLKLPTEMKEPDHTKMT